MKETRFAFTHDELLRVVKESFEKGIKAVGIKENPAHNYSTIDCLMAGFAVFTFKFPSLLKFDEMRDDEGWAKKNLAQLFRIQATHCDA
ncbi:hypothetical protein Bealeia1_01538 [Candidatus Bealeia paramacronuclearis]|uniref:Uncharacterized protein n=1 Tax=Candidatus Bealeia paramacronuclearis TaxID=1921001 RepID=A0ABZ2C4L1_9PROT|nr:hypothetical protein [Candidatus Bealeia paramacronuclearis]